MRTTKSRLLGTSALVGAGVALASGGALAEAQDPSISLGGFFAHDTIFSTQDLDANRGTVAHHVDAEVIFGLSGELENGIKIGGQIELEALSQVQGALGAGGDQIDETRLDISGAWGMVRLGMSNSGRYGATWSVAGPNVAHGVSSGVQTEWLLNPGGVGGFFRQPHGSAHSDISNDDPAITYFTPRFNGFQFTVTHRPTVRGGGSGGQNIGFADEMRDYTDAVDGSVHYAGDVGGVGVTLMAGAAGASASSGAGACGEDDYQAVNAGVRLSAMGFSVGGILTDVDDEQRCGSGTAMHVGASYGQGPWALSITAHDGDMEQTAAAGDSEMSVWSVGARYSLGSGVTLSASFQDGEITNEAGASNAGQAVIAGLRVGF